MSLERLERQLATLLSTPALPVELGPVAGGSSGPQAGLVIEHVSARTILGGRRDVELRPPESQGPRELRRIANVTARAVVTVRPGSGPSARQDGLAAAALLWWRCEADSVATGAGFPDDPAEGYRVEQIRALSLSTADDPATDGEDHRIALEILGAVWPRDLEAASGAVITAPLVRFASAAPARDPGALTVRAGATLSVPVEVDLRSFAGGDRDAPDAPDAPPRRIEVAVEALGDQPAGAVADTAPPLTGDRVTITYQAGAAPGRDRVVLQIVGDDGGRVPAGSIDVSVVA